MLNKVEAGRSTSFNFQLTGSGAEDFVTTMRVLQYPGDTPTIIKNIAYSCEDDRTDECGYIGTLTGVETASLFAAQDAGNNQWIVHMNAVDSDENLADPIKLYVSQGWA